MFTFVVDAMGSDLGPNELTKGVLEFAARHKDVNLLVYGDTSKFVFGNAISNIKVVNTTQVVPMECGAMQLMRLKDSSMVRAVCDMKENHYDAVISAGSTGGFLVASTLYLKNIPGVERAALCAPFPTMKKGRKTTILDIGASNENIPEHLVTFAKMGRIYSKYVLNREEPTSYLLSNGSEKGKGSPVSKKAYEMLEEIKFDGFKGNIEARDVLSGNADVIIAEGFSGNVLLKSVEGVASMMNGMIKKSFKRSLASKVGYVLAKKGFDDMKETMDYKTTGGAILLGVNGIVVKAHGNSDSKSFFYALEVALKMAEAQIVEKITEEVK